MSLKSPVAEFVKDEVSFPDMAFTLVFREVPEEKVFVAECLELPGCVSEGDTLEEAEVNIRDAVRACLSVIFEDCVRDAARRRSLSTSYVGISSQQTIKVTANPSLDLRVA
ncbi:MAG: type II toxin-antitoxin system HicB family antitoxin [Terracidiphilus sp.]